MRDVDQTPRRWAGVATVSAAALLSIGVTLAVGGSGRFDDASGDKVHATVVVPEPSRKMGEVRLVSRGDATVVQTLLSTRLLSRVIAEIRSKEEHNWPRGDESVKGYVAALEAARDTVEKRDDGDWTDRRRRLLIEFVADADSAAVLVGTFRTPRDSVALVPGERELFATLALPRAYVLRNMRLILADSFHLAEANVDRLGPLGPAAAAPAASEPKTPPTPAPKPSATPDAKVPPKPAAKASESPAPKASAN